MIRVCISICRMLLMSTGLTALALAQGAGTITTVSMPNYSPIVAPDSIASGFGTNLTTATSSGTLPLPTTLGNVNLTITDSSGANLPAPLYMVSPTQINFLVPANAALGKATFTASTPSGTFQGTLLISNVAPGIITADMSGKGVPAAEVLRISSSGTVSYEMPFRTGNTSTTFVTNPINVSNSGDQVYIVLFGSGIRRHSLNPVIAMIGGVSVPVQYAGPQNQFPGLDQINIGPLPQSLAGKGEVDLTLLVDGVPANTVRIAFQ